MIAVRITQGDNDLVVNEIEEPTPRPNDVIVEVRAASICGSDVHHLTGDLPIDQDDRPVTLGHEGAGVVVQTGENVTHPEPGDHVVINYVVSCGHCRHCLAGWDNRCRHRTSIGSDIDGTFAEYIRIPARSALRMPESLPFEWGSIAGCAVVTAFHAIRRSHLEAGDTTVVFGTGGVGLHVVMFASSLMSGRVLAVDPVESKLDRAEVYGADRTVNPSHEDVGAVISAETDGRGVDVSFECSGSPQAMEQAVAAVNGDNRFASGTVVSVGAQTEPISAGYWQIREGEVMVSGDHTRSELATLIGLLGENKVDLSGSIARRIPLEDVSEGIDDVANDPSLDGKIVVTPG